VRESVGGAVSGNKRQYVGRAQKNHAIRVEKKKNASCEKVSATVVFPEKEKAFRKTFLNGGNITSISCREAKSLRWPMLRGTLLDKTSGALGC